MSETWSERMVACLKVIMNLVVQFLIMMVNVTKGFLNMVAEMTRCLLERIKNILW